MAKEAEGTLFEVHVDKGDLTGKTWHGQFRAKTILSFGEQIRIDRLKRDLLGPGSYDGADPEVVAQAVILSELQVRITEAPEWWGGGIGHADTNLLKAVYEAANRVRDEHLKTVQKKGEADQAALRETRPQQ
jgi:hypothetical protein